MAKDKIENVVGNDSKIDYKLNDKNVEELFKNRQQDMVGLIEESIQDIQQMIISRGELHDQMLKNLDKIETFINNAMPAQGGASVEEIKANQDLMRELLKKKIELAELKSDEELNFWRDQALLKKELREHMKEFRDIKSKTSMLDNLIDMESEV